ncbi:MAG: transcription factor S [Promethearchaeota archaeon]
MKFCDKCGSLLVPKKIDNKKYLVCRACGWKQEITSTDKNKYKMTEKIDHSLDKTLVQDEEYYNKVYGTNESQKVCPRCGGKMIMHAMQTRRADEGQTIFWTCVKCHKTIRMGS